jgi:hypothetical protein
MPKTRSLVLVLAFAAGTMLACLAPAKADKAFRDEFIAKYVKTDSSDSKEKAFADACDKAKCNICHEGPSKKNRNIYGQALAKFLKRDTDKDNKEKIQAALDKVAAMKANPKDAKSPTFGDLIKAGKLPGGEPKKSGTAEISASK